MMRWVGLGVVVLLLVVGWFAYSNPERSPGGQGGSFPVLSLIWAVMALMLVSGAAWGFRRIRTQRNAAIAGILFWPAALIVIMLLYNWLNP